MTLKRIDIINQISPKYIFKLISNQYFYFIEVTDRFNIDNKFKISIDEFNIFYDNWISSIDIFLGR